MNNESNKVLQVRLPRATKRAIAIVAASRGVRINQVVCEALEPVIEEADAVRISEVDTSAIVGSPKPNGAT